MHPGEDPGSAGKGEGGYLQVSSTFPNMESLGFVPSRVQVRPYDLSYLDQYAELRNDPAADATSYLSPHLRFGTLSIRKLVSTLGPSDQVFLSELIWREFFMQILFHFPRVVDQSFKLKYQGIAWRNDPEEFELWSQGKTGYPMVDAGMRQLNTSGYMHNRVRMVTASFLCKHLLIDWRWGEGYFARKLLDYELSSNNGNWQWAAGTGCDAAPYFRVFNPTEQLKKFDGDLKYVKRWIPEFGTADYPKPMIEHKFARNRALLTYKEGLENYLPEL
jgi:deoxyribodipyrimidine photo-lyase